MIKYFSWSLLVCIWKHTKQWNKDVLFFYYSRAASLTNWAQIFTSLLFDAYIWCLCYHKVIWYIKWEYWSLTITRKCLVLLICFRCIQLGQRHVKQTVIHPRSFEYFFHWEKIISSFKERTKCQNNLQVKSTVSKKNHCQPC